MTSPPPVASASLSALLQQAQAARNASDWQTAIPLYLKAMGQSPRTPEIHHNLALCLFGAGNHQAAIVSAGTALRLMPALWQSKIILARARKAQGEMESADRLFEEVANDVPGNAVALLGRADLAMNEFGDPLAAVRLVKPLWADPAQRNDAELTTLMASLYDRDIGSLELTQQVMAFSKRALRLPDFSFAQRPARAPSARPRVALLSPLFCVSPVYFLTISGFRHVARGCDIVVFNRGAKKDWATDAFREIATEWHDVQHLPARQLAQAIFDADIEVLYDLGGWMDPVGLQALSVKPARQQFKWVGGQSITTGLSTFDGWIGDDAQSPTYLQPLYTEPLVNVPGGYATYTPPPYMPRAAARKSNVPLIFANPAKVSRDFLQLLAALPGKKCFVHRQYRYARVRERIETVLDPASVEYICPRSHQEALEVISQHKVMIDTFPYSGGLTAREARALGVGVKTRVCELFCERHGAG
ncbi:MAG: hypothetical protein Q7U14_09360 [Lacisediminimonas sp.]|nr:hypothetical protein [Lacisediminimonas sp.]